jgi:hypothetical protein
VVLASAILNRISPPGHKDDSIGVRPIRGLEDSPAANPRPEVQAKDSPTLSSLFCQSAWIERARAYSFTDDADRHALRQILILGSRPVT